MTLHAPYAFVPLSAWVYTPDWAHQITHDVPFSDGLSGSFDIEITAHTPTLCGGGEGDPVQQDGYTVKTIAPFRLPDQTCAIPGATTRGMIRNFIEIAGFGRMQFVDDRQFGIRDLTANARPLYQRRLVDSSSSPIRPLTRAGFLERRVDDRDHPWQIVPCEWARVPIEPDIVSLSRTNRAFWERRRTAADRMRAWRGAPGSLSATLWVDNDPSPHPHRDRTLHILYRKATIVTRPRTAQKRGMLVITGKTKDGLGAGDKKQEFFFYDPNPSASRLLPHSVFEAARLIHVPPHDPENPNPNWVYWFEQLRAGTVTRVPVFFIEDSSGVEGSREIESFGFAMMFKLAHKQTTHGLLKNTRRHAQAQSDHLDQAKIDLATALFGSVREERSLPAAPAGSGMPGLKGRVSFGSAKLRTSESLVDVGPVALMAPKAQFYPAYVRQPAQARNPTRLDGNIFASYTPLAPDPPQIPADIRREVRQPELAGWKLYPARSAWVRRPPLPGNVRNPGAIFRMLRVVAEGVFVGPVRFHNLRPAELGALVWAIELGGNGSLRHRVGMGKPLGLGNISIRIVQSAWNVESNRPGGPAPDKGEVVRAFEMEMEGRYRAEAGNSRSWRQSEQIVSLLAAADPAEAGRRGDVFSYMTVAEHRQVKQGGDLLPVYVPAGLPKPDSDAAVFPRPVPPATPQQAVWAPARPASPASRGFAIGQRVRDVDEAVEVEIVALLGGDPPRARVRYEDGEELDIRLDRLTRL